jgi:hypothetical protein
MAKAKHVCHAHFPHVRDAHARAKELGLRATLIRFNGRKKAFCFTYHPTQPSKRGRAGRPGGH